MGVGNYVIQLKTPQLDVNGILKEMSMETQQAEGQYDLEEEERLL